MDADFVALARAIDEQHCRTEAAPFAALEEAREAGTLLMQAEAIFGNGELEPWLEVNCRVPFTRARTYMRIAREWHHLKEVSPAVADVGIGGVLKLLGMEPDQQQQPTVDGKAAPQSDHPGSVLSLLDTFEAALLALPTRERSRAAGQAVERLEAFLDQHCRERTLRG